MKLPTKISGVLLLCFLIQGAVSFAVHHLPIPFDPSASAEEDIGKVIHYTAYSRAWIPEVLSALFLAALLIFFSRRAIGKHMERLAERERNYRSILFGLNDEIVVLDRDYRIRDINREKVPDTDVSREAAIGHYPFEVFPGGSAVFKNGETEETVAAVFRTKTPRQCRHRAVTEDGREMWKDIQIAPMTAENGETSHAILTVRDVTREVAMQGQLRQSQKLEAIGVLAGGIAHDFNNLLMTILLNIEYVLAKTSEGSAERESMEMALEAGRRASDLVDQLLTFSRKNRIAREPLALVPLVKEILKMLRASLPATIEIRREIDATSEMVLADPSQIQQILINLCANAADAMNGGGVITVELAPHRLAPEDPIADPIADPDLRRRDYLRLTVADTGAGMPESVQDKIFDPFFTTRPRQAVGMGLSTAHGVVKGMEGAILVRSAPDEGSRFDILLPVHFPEKAGDETAPLNGDGRAAGRILVVDDDNTVVQILIKTLTEAGYEATGETNGEAALNRFRASPDAYDLIITDLTMPGMTGIDLNSEIQAIRPDLPVVMTTGYGEVLSPEEARRMGIRELMAKPVSGVRLLALARRILGKEN
jgi:two-component system, cell cycle sensor histidine kinase and response regulator CckA